MITPYDLIGKFISGEANESEIEELMSWRKSDPKNEEEYLTVLASWGHSFNEKSLYENNKETAFDEVLRTIEKGSERNSFSVYLFIGIAAAIILGFGLSIFGGLLDFNKSKLISINSEGVKKEIVLPDSSIVLLNRNSMITYFDDFNGGGRTVDLFGEAYFEVTKDPNNPFVITAGSSKTIVLGTAFNLKAKNEENVQIIVTEGKVQFSDLSENKKEFLTVGEQAELKTSTLEIVKDKVIDLNAMAWKTGILKFDQTLLVNVAKVLSEYYQVEFTFDHAYGDFPLTFTIDQKSLEDTIELLDNITVFNIVKQGKTYHITK